MNFVHERARTQSVTAEELILRNFGNEASRGHLNAEFIDGRRKAALGVAGLPMDAPAAAYLLNLPELAPLLTESLLLVYGDGVRAFAAEDGVRVPAKQDGGVSAQARELPLAPELKTAIVSVIERVLRSPGELNDRGELLLDLKAYPVGPHFGVNLLLGNRSGYPYPLCTTPKSALDGFGRGSFRGVGGEQILATRCVLEPSENGEPANRQFYLIEDGKQIFYSADASENVKSASCRHSQNRSVISYETEDGLAVERTIFLLPQKDGMPSAVEAQRVRITNQTEKPRTLKIVMTGVFGIAAPMTVANDIVYANIVQETEILYRDGAPAAVTLHAKPQEERGRKKFAMLLAGGETMDEFCTNQADFIGSGSLTHPELAAHLPSHFSRKMAPFFAMGKTLVIPAGGEAVVDEFVGMSDSKMGIAGALDDTLWKLYETYKNPAALAESLAEVVEFWERYPSYIGPETDDARFNAYVGRNLPFQVLYQTYVSRAFAWTQKSYRETGFREIQDIYASMYYLSAIGENDLVKDLLGNWISQVYRMGYANHDFTFTGKEPGDCSDDQLWLVQAVYRYVKLTGDAAFLLETFPIAGEDAERTLWDTIMAILTYSGKISVGKHGLPLLDKADWNDTLRLDREVMKGPAKEALYKQQLAESGEPYGTPLKNDLAESTMNACLLKIAADAAVEMAALIGKDEDGREAAAVAWLTRERMQAHAWKKDFFARCLINDDREGGYTYLGSTGDGLSMDAEVDGSYFLNSYSWTLLADIADEEQIRTMLGIVNRYLRTEAGLKLCTLVDFDKLGVATGTGLYFPGDRENCGVFKHAAMMAAVASLKAAKAVRDESLARELAELAFFMIDRTLPYKTMDAPFVHKGNPRFCTQYNNSETCEHIGPMLSGTASWLTLAVYEFLGADVQEETVTVRPVLWPGTDGTAYTLRIGDTVLHVAVEGDGTKFRAGEGTTYLLDGEAASAAFALPRGGEHSVVVRL